MTPMTIGRLAQRAGVNVETIRYYQRVGLLSTPSRPREGFRHYDDTVLDRLRFIKRAQQLGFTLQETSELMALGSRQCADVRARAIAKRDTIINQINDLTSLRDTLEGLIADCGDHGTPGCPIVNSLTGSERTS